MPWRQSGLPWPRAIVCLIVIESRRSLVAVVHSTFIVGAMDHTQLTAEQFAPIIARLGEQRDYLSRLRERMEACGFSVDDPFYAAIVVAWQHASNACVVACTCRNRQRRPFPQPNTIMTRAPWGVSDF